MLKVATLVTLYVESFHFHNTHPLVLHHKVAKVGRGLQDH